MHNVDITASQRPDLSYIILYDKDDKQLWIRNHPTRITWEDPKKFNPHIHVINHGQSAHGDPSVNYLMELYYQIQCCEPIRRSTQAEINN